MRRAQPKRPRHARRPPACAAPWWTLSWSSSARSGSALSHPPSQHVNTIHSALLEDAALTDICTPKLTASPIRHDAFLDEAQFRVRPSSTTEHGVSLHKGLLAGVLRRERARRGQAARRWRWSVAALCTGPMWPGHSTGESSLGLALCWALRGCPAAGRRSVASPPSAMRWKRRCSSCRSGFQHMLC